MRIFVQLSLLWITECPNAFCAAWIGSCECCIYMAFGNSTLTNSPHVPTKKKKFLPATPHLGGVSGALV